MDYILRIGQYEKDGKCFAPSFYGKANQDNLINNINEALCIVHKGLDLYIYNGNKHLAFYSDGLYNLENDNDLLRFINERLN